MSNIFKNTLKSFKSDITGEEKDYKVNNAVWIYMESLFDLNQAEFDNEIVKGSNTAMCKFTTAVMKANGMDVTFEEVMENTDPRSVIKFYNGFFDIAFLEEIKEKEAVAKTAREQRKNK